MAGAGETESDCLKQVENLLAPVVCFSSCSMLSDVRFVMAKPVPDISISMEWGGCGEKKQ